MDEVSLEEEQALSPDEGVGAFDILCDRTDFAGGGGAGALEVNGSRAFTSPFGRSPGRMRRRRRRRIMRRRRRMRRTQAHPLAGW
jgi:hypothetical protein